MSLQITEKKADFSAKDASAASHIVVLMPNAKSLPALPGLDALNAALKRRAVKIEELAKSPIAVEIDGTLVAYAMVDGQAQTFERHTQIRKAWECLSAEQPESAAVAILGDADFRKQTGRDAAYVLAVNAEPLPSHKSKAKGKALKKALLFGVSGCGVDEALAIATGNVLTRSLTVLPPNELTPGEYRKRIKALAKTYGWSVKEYGFDKLKRMGAGAFCAVAQGSPAKDAAIVHVTYEGSGGRGLKKVKRIALVGKGICFDTGGHNLKPAKYMHGMHEDMNGSAVVLGMLAAASVLKLPVVLDGWLALAENHISPQAYRQNEVVTALNGTTIEVMHTDAEGRMVLADTLTLAVRGKPHLIADFATLTGSMHYALGSRMSGVFATSSELAHQASRAATASGERLVVFPQPADYDSSLDSAVADVKQCTLEGEADHILAARFLSRFVENAPWIHMDLSASACKGGLGAVSSEQTGFGVAWGVALLEGLK
ncbi:MAG TPA: leucyl aminopeptidase family protein [Thiobacillaceae bacterium]|nr:leucyl aminopeptidase family protein [Thiobacillaceae bacterium]